MSVFLKIVSVLYLAIIWLAFCGIVFSNVRVPNVYGATPPVLFLSCIGLSIPAAILFAFGQMVGDVRVMREYARQQSEHLRAMRAYYEPAVKS